MPTGMPAGLALPSQVTSGFSRLTTVPPAMSISSTRRKVDMASVMIMGWTRR